MPAMVIIILEPNLSLILPRRTENIPPIRKPNECAPEMAALLQPNSASRELRNIPQLLVTPCSTKSMSIDTITMVYP
jgi:hypothetical protein